MNRNVSPNLADAHLPIEVSQWMQDEVSELWLT